MTEKKHSAEYVRSFWEKVAIKGPDECWEWQSATIKGYGVYRHRRAHRVSYELAHGAMPDGLQACHTCDNPLCVNPKHLFAGTHEMNMQDRHEKDRDGKAFGERNARTHLTEEDVLDIRYYYHAGVTLEEIAEHYGMTTVGIGRIIRKETWGHVADPESWRL